jgi:hypothetical protein
MDAPPASHTTVRSSRLKSRLLPSLKDTTTEAVAEVGSAMGAWLAGFAGAAMADGFTVKFTTASGVGMRTSTVPVPPPMGTAHTDQLADRKEPQSGASPTCAE